MALVVFVFVINSSVNTSEDDGAGTHRHPRQACARGGGLPWGAGSIRCALEQATHGTALTPQDYLWLTLHLANGEQSQVRGIAADLALLPAISATYPGETLVGTPTVVAEIMGQTQVMFSFLSLALGSPPSVHCPPS